MQVCAARTDGAPGSAATHFGYAVNRALCAPLLGSCSIHRRVNVTASQIQNAHLYSRCCRGYIPSPPPLTLARCPALLPLSCERALPMSAPADAHTVLPPTWLEDVGLQVSVHTPRRGFARDLAAVLPAIHVQSVLLVPTCQRTCLDLMATGEEAAKEK
ncbi:hypothetical protein EON67_12410, partial [archaeon]